jgi:hypothetical protein
MAILSASARPIWQVALEAEAVDVLQWLVSVEDAPLHVHASAHHGVLSPHR